MRVDGFIQKELAHCTFIIGKGGDYFFKVDIIRLLPKNLLELILDQ